MFTIIGFMSGVCCTMSALLLLGVFDQVPC
jgi:hypothetical protein